VREFLEEAFAYASLDWQKYVKSSARYMRPLEVDCLICGHGKLAKSLAGKRALASAIGRIMVDADMEAAGLVAPGKGKEILENKFSDEITGTIQWPGRSRRSRVRLTSERVHGVGTNRRVVVKWRHGFLGSFRC